MVLLAYERVVRCAYPLPDLVVWMGGLRLVGRNVAIMWNSLRIVATFGEIKGAKLYPWFMAIIDALHLDRPTRQWLCLKPCDPVPCIQFQGPRRVGGFVYKLGQLDTHIIETPPLIKRPVTLVLASVS